MARGRKKERTPFKKSARPVVSVGMYSAGLASAHTPKPTEERIGTWYRNPPAKRKRYLDEQLER